MHRLSSGLGTWSIRSGTVQTISGMDLPVCSQPLTKSIFFSVVCSLKSTGMVKLPGLWETVGMPKEERPQTHEEAEAQKLVDRIEKKVSTQRKNRSWKTPSKPPLPKRNLRVVNWIGTIPAIGVCTHCSRQFKVPLESMKRVADAQWNPDLQFREHKCKREVLSREP